MADCNWFCVSMADFFSLSCNLCGAAASFLNSVANAQGLFNDYYSLTEQNVSFMPEMNDGYTLPSVSMVKLTKTDDKLTLN